MNETLFNVVRIIKTETEIHTCTHIPYAKLRLTK